MVVTAEVLEAARQRFVAAKDNFMDEPTEDAIEAMLKAAHNFLSAHNFLGVESDDDPDGE